MRSGIPRVPLALILALPLLPADRAAASAQFRDARIPEPGRVWLEINPGLLEWSEQFAESSPDSSIADGDREPLFHDFDGPIAERLFPGPDLFIADLNADAGALGYDPVSGRAFSLGRLDFQTIHKEVRSLELGFELGVIERLSIGARAPLVLTDVETAFDYDVSSATVFFSDLAFSEGDAFFTGARGALASLQALIDGGSLSGQELADAMALRDGTDAFLTALERRAMAGGLLPTGASAAGTQMTAHFGAFVAEFDSLGIALPALPLPMSAEGSELSRLFESPPIVAFAPGGRRNALNLGEIELSARISLLDGISAREVHEPVAAPDTGVGAAAAPDSARERRAGIRFRTTVGATLRLPLRSASFPPFENAAHFLDLPIGDGQTDIELALYQDVALGGWLLLRTAAFYGLQRPDELILRVHPPDRPYALESTQTVVQRDLGDYVMLVVRPGLRLNSGLDVGLEYDYFRLGAPSYSIAEPLPGVPDASPLEAEGRQTRHRVGVGFVYDLSEAEGRDELASGTRAVRSPWQFGISIRRAFAGSGGRTPASFRFGAGFRIPVRVF